MGDDKALPPQIFNGDQYCGVRRHATRTPAFLGHRRAQPDTPVSSPSFQDYDAFINAVEAEDGLWDFLKLPVPPKEEA